MHIVANIEGRDEHLTIEVKREYNRGSVNDYGLNSKEFTYFQYDCHDRPNDYIKEFRERQWFRGYLLGKKKDGQVPIFECYIQVKK